MSASLGILVVLSLSSGGHSRNDGRMRRPGSVQLRPGRFPKLWRAWRSSTVSPFRDVRVTGCFSRRARCEDLALALLEAAEGYSDSVGGTSGPWRAVFERLVDLVLDLQHMS